MKKASSRVLASSAATLYALLYPRYTKKHTNNAEEHASVVFRRQTMRFAMALLRLWAPYPEVMLLDTASSKPLDQCDASALQPIFADGSVKNLASLMFLNVFMSSECSDKTLLITYDEKARQYFFTQQICSFWRDHFYDDHDNDGHCRLVTLHEKWQSFTYEKPKNRAWWYQLLNISSDEEYDQFPASEHFLNEVFATAIRIYSTPMTLLETIMRKMLDSTHPEFHAFYDNVLFRLINFKKDFKTNFFQDKARWDTWVLREARTQVVHYNQHALAFKIYGDSIFTSENQRKQMSESMFVAALEQRIPDWIEVHHVEQLRHFSMERKRDCVAHLMHQLEREWSVIARNAHHPVWHVLNALTMNFHRVLTAHGANDDIRCSLSFVIHVIAKSIQLHNNHIAIFLMSQNQVLKYAVVLDDEYLLEENQRWKHCGLLEIAVDCVNQEMMSFLSVNAAVLETTLPEEKKHKRRGRSSSFFIASTSTSSRSAAFNASGTMSPTLGSTDD